MFYLLFLYMRATKLGSSVGLPENLVVRLQIIVDQRLNKVDKQHPMYSVVW